jgi:hypothetical protein
MNQKYWAAVRSNLLHFFFRGAQLSCGFYQPQQAARIWCRKTNSSAKPAWFDFFADPTKFVFTSVRSKLGFQQTMFYNISFLTFTRTFMGTHTGPQALPTGHLMLIRYRCVHTWC